MTKRFEKMVQELAQAFNPMGIPSPNFKTQTTENPARVYPQPNYPQFQIPPNLLGPKKTEPKKVVSKEYTIKARFVVKYDIIFMMLCLLMSLGMMTLLLNVSEMSQKIVNTAVAVTLSALISSFMFNYFKEPFKISFQWKNADIMMDVIKYVLLGIALILANTMLFSQLVEASAFGSDKVLYQASFVTISAISEELSFSLFIQSIIIASAKKRYHIILGTIGNGVLFSAYHIFVYADMGWIFVQLFVFRIILAVIYTKTKRISIPMLIHLINNAIPLVLMMMEVSA